MSCERANVQRNVEKARLKIDEPTYVGRNVVKTLRSEKLRTREIHGNFTNVYAINGKKFLITEN